MKRGPMKESTKQKLAESQRLRWTPEERAKYHMDMKDMWKGGKIQCMYCDKRFLSGSNNYREHLLFEHGKFMPGCSTRENRKLEWNTIRGFAQREKVLLKKQSLKRQSKQGKMVMMRSWRAFWKLIDNGPKYVNYNTKPFRMFWKRIEKI